HVHRHAALQRELLLQPILKLDVGAYQVFVRLEADGAAPVIDADENVEASTLESGCDFLTDLVFKSLELAGNLHVDIDVTVIHALDFNENRKARPLCSGGTETRHACDHSD